MKKILALSLSVCFVSIFAAPSAYAAESLNEGPSRVITSELPDGGTLYSFVDIDGSVLQVPYPPKGFDPITAEDEELKIYDIPPRPLDASGLESWRQEFSNYQRGEAPDAARNIDSPASVVDFTTQYGNKWAGWEVGTQGITNNNYVAVKGNFKVPSMSSGCDTTNGVDSFGAFIGLGGETHQSDLAQQGLAWCSFLYTSTNTYVPGWVAFTEFADSHHPANFCNTTWIIPSGHEVYENMSYQSSTDTAYFYMEDQTSGVVHSCNKSNISNWSYNGATADWIVEKQNAIFPNFGSLTWTNALAETGSDSTFHTISSQPNIRLNIGSSSSNACTSVTNVTNNTVFTVNWVGLTC